MIYTESFWADLRAHIRTIIYGSGLSYAELGRECCPEYGDDYGRAIEGFCEGRAGYLHPVIVDALEQAGLLPEEIFFSEDQDLEEEIAVQIPGQMNFFAALGLPARRL